MHHGISNPAFQTYRPPIASGGTTANQVFDGRMYKIHFFNNVGSNTLSVHSLAKDATVDYFAIGGGGRGGHSYNANIDGGCCSTIFATCCDMWGCFSCNPSCGSYCIGKTITYMGGGGSGGQFVSGSYNISVGNYDASVGAGATASDSSYTMPTHNSAQAPGTVSAISNTITSALSGKSSIFGYDAIGGNDGQDGTFGASGSGATGYSPGGGGVTSGIPSDGKLIVPSGGGSGALGAGANGTPTLGGAGGTGVTVWGSYVFGGGGAGGSNSDVARTDQGAAGTTGSTAFSGLNTYGGGGSGGKVQTIGTSKLYSIITAGGNGGSGTVMVRYPIEKPLPRVNLVENPNFESGIDYWSATNGSIEQSGLQSKSGSKSLRYVPTSNGRVQGGGSLSGGLIPVTTGLYGFVVSVKGNMGSFAPGIERYDSSGVLLGTSFTVSTTNNGNWREGVMTYNVPSGAAYVRLVISTSGYSSGQELFIDNILFEKTDIYPSGRFFDGNTPGGTWTGTQNLSQSKI